MSDQTIGFEENDAPNPNQSLPTWIWGTTAFIASYMVLHLQSFAA